MVGTKWIDKHYSGQDKPVLQESERKFKFGDSRIFNSLGKLQLMINVPVTTLAGYIRCSMEVDVVLASIPMLLSREALRKMKGTVNFETNLLAIDSQHIVQLSTARTGHLTMPFQPIGNDGSQPQVITYATPNEEVVTVATNSLEADAHSDKTADKALIRKMHLHLAHLNRGGLMRLLAAAGYKYELADLTDVLGNCS